MPFSNWRLCEQTFRWYLLRDCSERSTVEYSVSRRVHRNAAYCLYGFCLPPRWPLSEESYCGWAAWVYWGRNREQTRKYKYSTRQLPWYLSVEYFFMLWSLVSKIKIWKCTKKGGVRKFRVIEGTCRKLIKLEFFSVENVFEEIHDLNL